MKKCKAHSKTRFLFGSMEQRQTHLERNGLSAKREKLG
jgi:hypothetical protein